jgi:hypothetical protein
MYEFVDVDGIYAAKKMFSKRRRSRRRDGKRCEYRKMIRG